MALELTYGADQFAVFAQRCTPSCLLDAHRSGALGGSELAVCSIPAPTALGYSTGRFDNGLDVALHPNHSRSCDGIVDLDLSSNGLSEASFAGLNVTSLTALGRIDLSNNNFTSCPDFADFSVHGVKLTIDLSNNAITNCAPGVFCGLELQELNLGHNRLGAETGGVINIGDWFDCSSSGGARRARDRRDTAVLARVINLVGNTDLSSIADVGSLAVDALSVAGSNVSNMHSLPGNCIWRSTGPVFRTELKINTGFQVEPTALDGASYDANCTGNIRFRIGALPDCIAFDRATAVLTVGLCTEDELLTIPRSLIVVRYDSLDEAGSFETVAAVIIIVYNVIQVGHSSTAVMLADQYYGGGSGSYRLTAPLEVVGGCNLSYLCHGCNGLPGLTVGVRTGALLFDGTVPAAAAGTTMVVTLAVNDTCTGAGKLVDEVNVSLAAPLAVTWDLALASSPFQLQVGHGHPHHTGGFTIEFGWPMDGWGFVSAVNRPPFDITYGSDTLPTGLVIERRLGGTSDVVISGSATEYGVKNVSVFIDEIHGTAQKQSVRSTVLFRNSTNAPVGLMVVTVVECLDHGNACDGTCVDTDGDPFSGVFRCRPDNVTSNTERSRGKDSGALGGDAIAAVTSSLAMLVLGMTIAILLYRRSKNKGSTVGPWAPPPPDPRFEIDRDALEIQQELGSGQFGVVFKATYKTKLKRGRKGPELEVAVKSCTGDTQTAQQKGEFLAEGETMKPFNHPKIVRLIGLVTQTEPMLLITEFMALGDLHEYLKQIRIRGRKSDIKSKSLVRFTLDIAQGLLYLEQVKFVHRDIASRNMLVSKEKVIKISDFGLSRKIEVNDAYRQGGVAMLPVRWMAPECMSDGRFSVHSDIWSFAICAWEIYSGSIIPYSTLSNSQILDSLMDGVRLNRPMLMPESIYTLCIECWHIDDDERPSHGEIQLALECAMQSESDDTIVDFGRDAGLSNPVYDLGRKRSTERSIGRSTMPESACVVKTGGFNEELYDDSQLEATMSAAAATPRAGPIIDELQVSYELIGQRTEDTVLYSTSPAPSFRTPRESPPINLGDDRERPAIFAGNGDLDPFAEATNLFPDDVRPTITPEHGTASSDEMMPAYDVFGRQSAPAIYEPADSSDRAGDNQYVPIGGSRSEQTLYAAVDTALDGRHIAQIAQVELARPANGIAAHSVVEGNAVEGNAPPVPSTPVQTNTARASQVDTLRTRMARKAPPGPIATHSPRRKSGRSRAIPTSPKPPHGKSPHGGSPPTHRSSRDDVGGQ